MTNLFGMVTKLENPTIDVAHSLKMARGFIDWMSEAARDGLAVTANDWETAEFAMDEVAAKFEALAAIVETLLAESVAA